MSTLYELYKAIIEDCYSYSFTQGDDKIRKNFQDQIDSKKFGNEIDTKVNILHTLATGVPVKDYRVKIKEEITKFFGNLLKFSSIELDISITNNDEYYYAYGILCGFVCLFDPSSEEEHKIFNYSKYKNYCEIINQCENYQEMEGYFKNRYKSFLNENNDNKNLELEWFKILFNKKLSTLPIPNRKKKKKQKKKEKSLKFTENNIQKENIDEGKIFTKEEDTNEEETLMEEDQENTEFSLSSNSSIIDNITSEVDNLFNNNNNNSNNNSNVINNETIDKLKSFLKKNFKKINEKINKINKENRKTAKRLTALENHVVLIANHLTLLQTSRDIGKSIFHYLYEHFNLKDAKGLSDETEKVMDFLGSDISAEKVDELLNEESKKTLSKFLKCIFFINEYLNNILHKRIKDSTQSLISNMSKKENYFQLTGGFTYDEWWKSLTFFVNNMINNDEIQLLLNDAYSKYKENNYGKIMDFENEIILRTNEKIQLLINNDDLDSIKDYFSKIKFGKSRISFEECCNKTSWNNGVIAY